MTANEISTPQPGAHGLAEATPTPPAVETKGVSRVFHRVDSDFVALHEVDLTIRRGEFVALVGPSGCGKSTLLRMVGGLLLPSSGSITVNGVPVTGPRRDMALMFQKSTLFPWRTVLDNVLLPIDVHRKRVISDVDTAVKLLRLVNLEDFRNHYPRELSGGMQQRVALCRVLMSEPSLMLLDEPFGSLDEFTREKLNVELGEILQRSGSTGLLVTHNINEAVFLADRVLTMDTNPGRISGQVQVLADRPRPLSFMRDPLFLDTTLTVRELLRLE